jgi:hypothetical protein
MSVGSSHRFIRDPILRRFVHAVLLEYRRSGSASGNENFKHVLRMSRSIRSDREGLGKIGADPEELIAAILLSDLGKEDHILERYLDEYEGRKFRAFLDHSRISMREGNRIRKEVGLSARTWKKILGAVIGHDGPSIEGSWWKRNYESELGKPYARLHTKNALIHCYLDRIDQGALFRSASGQLNGGLRKISYDIFKRGSGISLSETISEVFGPTRDGTREQLEYLDEVEKPRLLGSEPLPALIREMKRKFIDSEKYFERILINDQVKNEVRIVMDDGSLNVVGSLDDFWKTLSLVTPRGTTK